ncbi:MAG: 30S ribosomal protein S17 [Spirochaetota bacterium]|nr:30S ribosomal protein S17 [Spirochaetota bacterium]
MANIRKQLQGKVVSNKMDKTIVVEIERMMMHPLYKKSVIRSRRVKSHDSHNTCNIGDVVKIEETRPLSSSKRYRLVEVITKAK